MSKKLQKSGVVFVAIAFEVLEKNFFMFFRIFKVIRRGLKPLWKKDIQRKTLNILY
jgi:hypothetical protein